jgi:hypothetical protein
MNDAMNKTNSKMKTSGAGGERKEALRKLPHQLLLRHALIGQGKELSHRLRLNSPQNN